MVTVPVALVLGVVAVVRTARTGQRGRGLAIAGVAASLVWGGGIAAGVVALGTLTSEPKRDAAGRIAGPGQVLPDTLKTGDCVATVEEGEVRTVRVVRCGTAASAEVFAIFELPAGPWPGAGPVESRAGRGCTQRYEASGRQAGARSDVSFFGPTELSWRLGDHRVVCLVGPSS